MKQGKVAPAEGKLGIMVVGCGAVTTTFMTGSQRLGKACRSNDTIRQDTCWKRKRQEISSL